MTKHIIIILVSLMTQHFCRAADPDASWLQAIARVQNPEHADDIHLNDQGITAIPNDVSLPRLRLLNLNNNQIQRVVVGPTNLPQLTHLELEKNQIKSIELSLSLLRVLNLAGNQVETMRLDLPQLKTLYFADNQITNLDIIPQLDELGMLDLSDNHITSIDADALLNKLPKLRLINLSGNDLDEEDVTKLRDAARARDRDLITIAQNLRGFPARVKAAKRDTDDVSSPSRKRRKLGAGE